MADGIIDMHGHGHDFLRNRRLRHPPGVGQRRVDQGRPGAGPRRLKSFPDSDRPIEITIPSTGTVEEVRPKAPDGAGGNGICRHRAGGRGRGKD